MVLLQCNRTVFYLSVKNWTGNRPPGFGYGILSSQSKSMINALLAPSKPFELGALKLWSPFSIQLSLALEPIFVTALSSRSFRAKLSLVPDKNSIGFLIL